MRLGEESTVMMLQGDACAWHIPATLWHGEFFPGLAQCSCRLRCLKQSFKVEFYQLLSVPFYAALSL
jgi:hypothetical protein